MPPKATRLLHLDAWKSYFPAAILLVAVLGGLLRSFVFEWNDPYHCYSLITRGRWLDADFTNWQPENCIMHTYMPHEIQQCLRSKRVIFIGDSTARQLFYSMAHLADPTLPVSPPSSFEKHSDVSLPAGTGTWFDFFWDPFLNSTKTNKVLKGTGYGGKDRPALLVLGSGLWYLRHKDEEGGGGGIAGWEGRMEQTLEQIKTSMPVLADEVIFLPVINPTFSKLSPERAEFIQKADIDAMNMDLILRISPFTSVYDPPVFPHGSELQGSMNSSFESARVPPIPALFPSVLNKMLHSSQTLDGLHYSSLVMRSQSQILLNLRCNEHFPNRFPFDKTCCSRYPQANWIQALVVVCVIFLGPLLWVGGNNENRVHWALRMAPSSKHSRSFIALGVAVAFCYTADRTGLWTKEQKQFDWTIFGVLCFLGMAACVISGKKGPTHPGLLHRAQTDEWKGWMQIIVLIYHYMDASKLTSVYPIVRTLVASYLFMTGYGHTTFHLKTANYSPLRAAQVLVRLNLLTITLTYVMDTNYMFYYFTPLVSFWYIVVYLTLFIGSFRNDHTLFLAGKIFASFIFVRFIHSQIWIIEGVFRLLNTLANVNWTAEEWAFRVKLDSLIVYVGMLVSITFKLANSGTGSSQGRRLIDHPRWPWVLRGSLGVCILGIAWFILFETSTKSKHTYNVWHPYVSVIPVLAYVGLRNATPVLRETSSRVAEWIGKISLELYVLQSHIWLASDTKGILVLVPGPSSRTINFVVSTIGFVCISHAVAKATKELTKLICGEEEIEFPTAISTANTPIILRNLPSPVTESTSVFLNTSVAPVFSTERDTGHPGSSEPTVENTASILTVAYDNDRTKDETDDGVDTTVRLDKEESSLTSREVAGNELGESQQLAPITPFRKPLHEPQEKSTSLPIRLTMCIGVLWILNIVWPVSSGE